MTSIHPHPARTHALLASRARTARRVATQATGRSLVLALATLLVLAAPSRAQVAPAPPVLDPDAVTAFVGATLLPMRADTADDAVLRDHTLLVRGDRILALGPSSELSPPEGARLVDASGRWLMPGLVDAHVHVWYADELLLYVANGVTTVRNMWGSPTQRRLVERVSAGELVGPSIFSSGPITDGSPPLWNGSAVADTPEQARQAVADQAAEGYEFLKVYDRLPRAAYEELVRAAEEHGLLVCGHVPRAVGWRGALAAGQRSIEHLSGFGEFLEADAPPTDEQLAEVVGEVIEAGTWNCPTLVVYTKFVPAETSRAWFEQPEMAYVLPTTKAGWDPARDFRLKDKTPEDFARLALGHDMRLRFVRALHEAGAGLLMGTDAPNPFVIPGFAVHEELAFLTDAGLTPYEALLAATRDVARAHDLAGAFGTLEPGARADLLLLEADPLEELGALQRRAGVMAAGRWYPESQLQARLEELADRLTRPPDFLDGWDPPPALGGLQGTWDVRFNETRLAMERASLAPDLSRVVTQLAYDPGLAFFVTFDQRRLEGSGERTHLDVTLGTRRGTVDVVREDGTLRLTGTGMYADVDLERPIAPETLLSLPSLSTESRLWARLEVLGVGETVTLERVNVDVSERIGLSDTVVVAQRLPDKRVETPLGGRTARAYELASSDVTGTGSVVSDLWIDITTGRPLGLEQREQTGVIRAVRLR